MLSLQVFELLKLNFGVIAAKRCRVNGKTYTVKMQIETIAACERGELDAVAVTMQCGSNGCNLQGMNWMIALGPIARQSDELQAKGEACSYWTFD